MGFMDYNTFICACLGHSQEEKLRMEIKTEAKFTTFEAISMIVGNSIGTGIIAVPYLATKNSLFDVVWMVVLAYIMNVILHLII